MLIFYTAKAAAELMPGDQLLPAADPYTDPAREWPAIVVDRVAFEGQGVEVAGWPPGGRPDGPGRRYRKVRRYAERHATARLAVSVEVAAVAWTKIVNRATGADAHQPEDERATVVTGEGWSLGVRVGNLRVWVGGAGDLLPLLEATDPHRRHTDTDAEGDTDAQMGVLPALPDAD